MSPTASMLRMLVERDISSDASSFESTFSSWDNCMAKPYCKWPVIAGIIVGSLIVLGIISCCVSCICCGYRCCEGCCGCCYRCCDCGGSRHDRSGGNKYADDPRPYYQQPPPPEPMNYGYRQPIAAESSLSAGPPPAYRGPQTASFDQPFKVHANEDELPPMPTWADAQTRRVEDHTSEPEEMEMDDLNAVRDHSNSPLYHNGVASPPPAGGLNRNLSHGGYNQVPGNYPNAHMGPSPGPQPMYNDGYSPNGSEAGYGGVGNGGHDQYPPYADQGHYGGAPAADTHYFNQNPHSPGSQSPGYGPPPAGFPPRTSPRPSPAPYRGFENQPAPKVQAPNYNAPGVYNKAPSPGPMGGAGYSPYNQQPQQHYSPTHSPPPSMQPGQGPGQYRAFSPQITSPPTQSLPSFHDNLDAAPNNEDRPPSLLMAGRRPAPNTFRDV